VLERAELIRLFREHRDEWILSLYLDAEENDPARRRTWRLSLEHAVDKVRKQIGAKEDQRAGFEKALAHLERQLGAHDSFLPERGWAGFATETAILYAESLPVRMPDLARWRQAPAVAPYVRALRQCVPVLTVLVDHRQAKIFRYLRGQFEELRALHAVTDFGDLSDNTNMSKRGTRTTGVRGVSDSDSAHRLEQVSAERLVKQLSEMVQEQAGAEGLVVVGGPPETTAAAMHRLAKSMRDRITEDPTISFVTSPADLKRATETAAAAVTSRRHERLVGQIVDLTGAGGRGCLGREATEKALSERRVELLLLSHKFLESDPDGAERCTDDAFDQDAAVEELVGPGAEHLDRAGEGIAARLRFTA
jgi:hypothetical protein